MASTLYPEGKTNFMKGNIALLTDTIKIALIDTGVYTYNAAHDAYDDVSAGVIGTPQTLSNKSVTTAVFDADDPVWTSLSGNSV